MKKSGNRSHNIPIKFRVGIAPFFFERLQKNDKKRLQTLVKNVLKGYNERGLKQRL